MADIDRMNKAELKALILELRFESSAAVNAVRAAVESLGVLSDWQRARAAIAVDLAHSLGAEATKAGDKPKISAEIRAILSELEPPLEPEDDEDAELEGLAPG